MSSRRSIVIRNNTSDLVLLAEFVDQFCHEYGLGTETAAAINIVLDELCANVIMHAFEDTMGHDISVHLQFREGAVIGEVEDDGREFNPLDIPSPDVDVPLEQRQIGGLGIHLIRNLMDDVSYERRGTRNIVTVLKNVRSPD